MQIFMIIYSLRPVSTCSLWSRRKTKPKNEMTHCTLWYKATQYNFTVRLEGHFVERMYLRQKCFAGSVNKTILKPRLTVAAGHQYVYVGFSRHKIPRSRTYTISEKAIRFRHPDYNPDPAQKLISSSMSRHLSTRNDSSKSMHMFLSNLANRQTDTGKNIYLLLCLR